MLQSASGGDAGGGEEPIGSGDRRGAASRLEAVNASALLHATRAASFRADLIRSRNARFLWLPRPEGAQQAIARFEHKVAFARLLVVRTVRAVREDGPAGMLRRVLNRTLGRRVPVADRLPGVSASPENEGERTVVVPIPRPVTTDYRSAVDTAYERTLEAAAGTLLAHRVLLVAETALPQCAKYRVWQKKGHFDRLGMRSTVVDWRHWTEALSRLQTHALLILYRVPLFPDLRRLVSEARRLGVTIIWEVDDLIFDLDLYARNANLASVSKSERDVLLGGVRLYREMMMASDRTIASTATLARLMEEATGRPSHVVENALDRETLDFAAASRRVEHPDDGRIVLFYGSGTTTHDADVAVAAASIARALRQEPRLVFRIVGPLNLPSVLDGFGDRIERLPLTDYRNYLAALARADISIAPLEKTIFNDAKSNIKLIEAAIVGVASICSPAAEFRRVVTDGIDAILAESEDEWAEAILALARDPTRRRAMGDAAQRMILARYDTEAVAIGAVAPIAALVPARRAPRFRVLVVNIYYAPRSLGGATIVAEDMARRLHARGDTEVYVFTSQERKEMWQYALSRYDDEGVPVIGVTLPLGGDNILTFDDPEMGRVFEDVLAAVEPDVVHFHSIQDLGAGLPRACQSAGIPYVVTLHDAWWLCPRQFMVRADNTYCHQTTIDLKVCQPCVPDISHLQGRMHILMQCLDEAALLLSPSASHAALYRANGIPESQIRVNRNGLRRPGVSERRRSGPLRFAFVGGNNAVKGVGLIREAFARVARTDWTLRVVDASRAVGFSSFRPSDWRLRGEVEIVPPYTQNELDAFYEEVDVLLFPSQWRESFGLTVREALLRDVWVVVTESGAAAEDVEEGVNGTIIPMRNEPDRLAAAIETLLERRTDLRRHRNPLKDRIATPEQQAEELHRLLAEASARPLAAGLPAG